MWGEERCLQGFGRCRWEDNIKMVLREIGIERVNWIWLPQDRVHGRLL
jgi:hypothetical protein